MKRIVNLTKIRNYNQEPINRIKLNIDKPVIMMLSKEQKDYLLTLNQHWLQLDKLTANINCRPSTKLDTR